MQKKVVLISTSHIGIDLGSRYIKIALLGPTSEAGLVEGAIYPTKGILGDKRYFKSLRDNIKDFVEEHDLGIISMSFTISPFVEGVTTATILRLPTVDKKVLKKAIKFEMGQRGIVENVADHHVLYSTLEEGKAGIGSEESVETDILLTTVKKSLIYEIAQLRKVKWKAENIELQVSTLGRFTRGNAVVIDFGHQSTRIYLFKQNILKSMEVVGNGGKGVTETIQNELEAPSFDVAEDLKHQSVLPFHNGLESQKRMNESLNRASRVVTDESEFLISEIKRIIRGFELREFIELDHVYYTGGMAQTENFVNMLTDELEYDVKPFISNIGNGFDEPSEKNGMDSSSHGVEVSPQKVEPIKDEFADFFNKSDVDEGFHTSAASLSNPIPSFGLESERQDDDGTEPGEDENCPISTLFLDKTEINEPEQENEPDEPEEPVQWTALAYAAGMFHEVVHYPELNYEKFMKYKFDFLSLLIAVAFMSMTLHIGVPMISEHHDESIQQLNASISQQNVLLQETNQETEQLNKEKSESDKLISRIGGLQAQKEWYSQFLFQLPAKTPNGVVVEHINIQGKEISLNGYSTNYSDIGFFAMGLEELGATEIVEIMDIEESQKYANKIEDTMTKSFEMKVQQ